jgi:hypothetical protein
MHTPFTSFTPYSVGFCVLSESSISLGAKLSVDVHLNALVLVGITMVNFMF